MKIKAGQEDEYAKYKALNSTDPYSARCVSYGEEWADLMETLMAQGKPLPEIAKAASHQADTDGVTGFMYGAAVSGLSAFWEHGEELRRWHNRDTQIGTEGDRANETGAILNPAIMTIDV